MRRLGLGVIALALAGLAIWGFATRQSVPDPPGKAAALPSPASDATSASTLSSPASRTPVLQSSAGPESSTVHHRGLPASLAEFPRTREFERGIEALQEANFAPFGNEAGLLDYRLRFLNRLETCLGTPPPSVGDIQYEVLFQPDVAPDGTIRSVGSANHVAVRKSHDVSDADLARLTDCGGKAAYGLPLEIKVLPKTPEYHLYVFLKFPITEDSFPYKVLRTGHL